MNENKLKDIAARLLADILSATKPANEILNAFTRTHKFLGAKDRRFLSDIVWSYLRHKARLNYAYPDKQLRALLDLIDKPLPDLSQAPQSIQWEVPEWIIPHINNADKELPALLEIPDIILRANGDREKIQKQLAAEGIETSPTKLSPLGLILKKRTNLAAGTTYRSGLVEIQDEASQLVALACEAHPHMRVLDYCAGAGGKSLVFAQTMKNRGVILAHDVSKRSLTELKKRAERAHVSIIETTTDLSAHLKENFDIVVVDAPCSGTGTWRRCPDARWKLTQEQLAHLVKTQAQILQKASVYTKKNGKLIYITCSLTQDENINQVQAFLKKNTAFRLCTHTQFSPFKTQTDGLFYAKMERTR